MAALDYSYFPFSFIRYSENDIWDRYKHYLREQSVVEFGASLFNSSIEKAADKIAGSLGIMSAEITSTIQRATERICSHLDEIHQNLSALNRRLDIMIEQQRMTNLLLQNVADLLKIPNSEKERLYAITNGIRFMANASINPKMYGDALEEFLKAESYQKQDYFVLHRIGCIYLYSEEHLDPKKAQNYFSRAAEYAKIESDPNAVRMANLLTNSINTVYTQSISNENSINLLAADSFEKAAFAAYVANDLPKAIEYQESSIALNSTPERLFLLSKYQSHENNMESSLPLLKQAIDGNPNMAVAVFQEVDMMIQPDVIHFVESVDAETRCGLEELVKNLKGKMSTVALKNELTNGTFASRYKTLKRYRRRLKML